MEHHSGHISFQEAAPKSILDHKSFQAKIIWKYTRVWVTVLVPRWFQQTMHGNWKAFAFWSSRITTEYYASLKNYLKVVQQIGNILGIVQVFELLRKSSDMKRMLPVFVCCYLWKCAQGIQGIWKHGIGHDRRRSLQRQTLSVLDK